MSYFPDDLLDQARSLATSHTKRPRSADLRRAVSAAYYALFHLLTDESAAALWPAREEHLRSAIRRAFDHKDMLDASKAFNRATSNAPGAKPEKKIATLLNGAFPSADLREVAKQFVALQNARHLADYDRATKFQLSTVSDLLDKADAAFAAWSRIRSSDEAKGYLLALLMWKRLDR